MQTDPESAPLPRPRGARSVFGYRVPSYGLGQPRADLEVVRHRRLRHLGLEVATGDLAAVGEVPGRFPAEPDRSARGGHGPGRRPRVSGGRGPSLVLVRRLPNRHRVIAIARSVTLATGRAPAAAPLDGHARSRTSWPRPSGAADRVRARRLRAAPRRSPTGSRPRCARSSSARRRCSTQSDRDALCERVLRLATGLGPLEPLLADPAVDEVMVNGPGRSTSSGWADRALRCRRSTATAS